MKNPIKKIKQKIKVAKISGIIFAIVFLALIINSICLTYKVHKLEKQNYNHKIDDKMQGNNGKYRCGNH